MRSLRRLTKRSVVAGAVVSALVGVGVVAITATATPSLAASCTGYVALTFDDGPSASNTTTLLATLKAAGARATLFNIGQNAQANPTLVQAEYAAGMWIGNHSWTHPYMTQLTQAQMTSEISQTQNIIQQLTGVAPQLFRPPYFDTNATLKAVEAQFGLTEIITDVDSQDWNGVTTDQIVQSANNLQAGGIILMHDWPANTIAAIPQIVTNLAARGLCPGMISPTTARAVAPDSSTTPSSGAPSTSSAAPTTPSSAPASSQSSQSSPCTATYRQVGSWSGGFQGEVTVSNTATSAINGWTVTMTLPSGVTIQSLWSGVNTGVSGAISVKNASYNGAIAAGGSTAFGFVAASSGSTTPSAVTCVSP